MANFVKKIIEKLLGASHTPSENPEVITKTGSAEAVITAPLSPESLSELEQKTQPLQFIVGCGHSMGQQRDHNEDALFTLCTTILSDSMGMPFGLFIVADGMGGHQHGEIASGLAVRAMASYILRKLYLPFFDVDSQTPDISIQEILQEGVYEAHRVILKNAIGGGTTLTAVLIMGNQMMISHVGDSRAYAIMPDGRCQIMTRDHSLVKRLEELGQITSSEAAVHPQRNVLYRALGQGEPFEPDITTYPIPHNGYLLLCSDGLWGLVPEKEIIQIILVTPTPHEACQKLVNAANKAGGPDNITAVLIRVTG